MHIIGTDGMPRRIYTYESGMGWDLWYLVATVGSFLMAASVLLFLWNLMVSLRRGAPAGNDPWDAATLEWSVSSPPPLHNFDQIPVVHSRRPLWDHKYPEHAGDGHGAAEPDPLVAGFEQPAIHLPSPTYSPLILGVGLTTLFFGILYSSIPPLSISLAVVGLALVAFAIVGWVRDSHKDSPYAAH